LGRYLARDERAGQGSWQRTYYHQDHLGSTRALSGADSGTIAYEPFGSLVHEVGATEEHKHRFTGKPIDGTGLYYYGARFYDPELGKFVSMDPAKDGLNWYVYAHNNPLKYVDPTGMWGSDVHNRDDEKRIGTYYWALQAGMDSISADILAERTYGVDFGWLTNPVLGQEFHFNTNSTGRDSRLIIAERELELAISLKGKANSIMGARSTLEKLGGLYSKLSAILYDQALEHLALGLHALQDSHAHTPGYTKKLPIPWIKIYHHLGVPGVDSAFTEEGKPDPRMLAAGVKTIEYLRRFLREGVGIQ
jgi:RHS repeat-associated protein